MLNVTVVAPPLRVAVAVVVWIPGRIPSVRTVVACPLAPVIEDGGVTEPPPLAVAHVTVTLPTGLPFASVTSTSCGVPNMLPTCPVRLSPENFTSAAAAPAVPVAVNVTGLPVNPPDVAVSVFGPAVVPSVHDVTAAIPLGFVVTGAVGF